MQDCVLNIYNDVDRRFVNIEIRSQFCITNVFFMIKLRQLFVKTKQ